MPDSAEPLPTSDLNKNHDKYPDMTPAEYAAVQAELAKLIESKDASQFPIPAFLQEVLMAIKQEELAALAREKAALVFLQSKNPEKHPAAPIERPDVASAIPDVWHSTILRILIDRPDVQTYLKDKAGFNDQRIGVLRTIFIESEIERQHNLLNQRISAADERDDYRDRHGNVSVMDDGEQQAQAASTPLSPVEYLQDYVIQGTINRAATTGSAALTAADAFRDVIEFIPKADTLLSKSIRQHKKTMATEGGHSASTGKKEPIEPIGKPESRQGQIGKGTDEDIVR